LVTKRALFRPGGRPLTALADALLQLGLPREVGRDAPAAIGTPGAFAAAVQRGTPAGQINLVVLDQFEEVFTPAAEPAQRDALIAILSALPPFREVRTHIVATLRSDYLGEVHRHAALRHLYKQGFDLGEMSEAELRAAVEHPLHVRAAADPRTYGGKAWEPELVAELARQTAPQAAYLPLLQLTLTELWRRGRLTLAASGNWVHPDRRHRGAGQGRPRVRPTSTAVGGRTAP
jgi:hypothetical protein